MELIGKISLLIHIAAGVSTLLSGPVAIFYNAKTRVHRIAGKAFFYAMSVVLVTSVIGFVQRPDNVFYQFLLGISALVAYNVWKGVRAILFMKRRSSPGPADQAVAWVALFFGAAMLNAAVWYFFRGTNVALPILFGVFGLLIFTDAWRYRKLLNASHVTPQWWFRQHIDAMFGAFIASTTAFTVNAADFLPWYIQWFGPTVALQPLAIYFLAKRKLRKKDLGNPLGEASLS